MRKLLTCVAACAAALCLPAVAAAAPPSYVALGDSYTSAPLVLPIAAGSPLECGQSAVNYPHLTAAALGLSLTDRSCGGATTADMTTSQFPGVGPQFDALSSSTDVVTIGIGGNDNGLFAGAIADCLGADWWDFFDYGSPCKSKYGNKFADEVASDAPVIAAALQGIHARSPHARVLVIGYPDILPQSGNCWPTIPLTSGDTAYMNGLEKTLNSMLASQAGANGATFVDTYTSSIGHDACKAEGTRWIEPVLPGTDAFPIHPNAAGEANDARVVEGAL